MSGQKVALRLTDPVLTQLALGYRNNALVGEHLLPVVDIPKEGAKLPVFSKEAFVIEDRDERELFGASNLITPTQVESKLIEVTEKDLAYPIDYREGKEAEFAYEQYALSVLQEKMALAREKRIRDLVCNDSIYGSSNQMILSGSSQFSEKDSSIFDVFDDAFETVRRQAGVAVNTIIISADAWAAIRNHRQVLELMKYRGIQRLSPALFAEMLKGDEQSLSVYIGRGVYRNRTDSREPTPIWRKDIVMAYVPKADDKGNRGMYTPSFGYTFRRQGSLLVDKYDKADTGGKVYNLRCTSIDKEYVLMPEAGFLIRSAV